MPILKRHAKASCFVIRFRYKHFLGGCYLNRGEETSALFLLFRIRLILVNSAEIQLGNFMSPLGIDYASFSN